MKTILSRNNTLASNFIMIDGFSSSGKSLILSILSYIDRIEQPQIDYFYEHLAVLNYQEKISLESMRAILQIRSDQLLYDLFIGRNVNFRTSDVTSPFSNGSEEKYIKRLKVSDGDNIKKKILKTNPILPLHIHYVYGYSNIFLEAFQNKSLLYIIMLRDPFYLIKEWDKGNWVKGMSEDERNLHLCLNYNNKIIPWFAKEYASEYIKANDLEKAILTVYQLYKRIFSMYNNSKRKEKEKILIVFFEDFINHPNLYIDQICKKIKTKRSKNFNAKIKKLSLPRDKKNLITTFKQFKSKHSKSISPKYNKMIADLNTLYLDFYFSNKLV
jgi:hypothetical protein